MKHYITLLTLSLVCLISCKSKPAEVKVKAKFSVMGYMDMDSSRPQEKLTQFECGTSDIKYFTNPVDEWEDAHPGGIKRISLLTTKEKLFEFFDLLPSQSLNLTLFDRTVIENFYIPSARDSIWFVGPIDQYCVVTQSESDKTPIKISVSLDDYKRLVLTLCSDSTIVNSMSNVIIQNRLGQIQFN